MADTKTTLNAWNWKYIGQNEHFLKDIEQNEPNLKVHRSKKTFWKYNDQNEHFRKYQNQNEPK